MAEFTTIKKSEIKELVEYAVAHVQQWSIDELFKLAIESKKPLCIPVKDKGFVVGRYLVEKITENHWKVYDRNQDFVREFYYKSSAILYCACMHIRKYQLAQDIYRQDTLYGRIDTDLNIYKVRLQNCKKTDGFKRDLYVARFINSKLVHDHAYTKLRKLLDSAKYLQIRE